jgi:hypothetical protein
MPLLSVQLWYTTFQFVHIDFFIILKIIWKEKLCDVSRTKLPCNQELFVLHIDIYALCIVQLQSKTDTRIFAWSHAICLLFEKKNKQRVVHWHLSVIIWIIFFIHETGVCSESYILQGNINGTRLWRRKETKSSPEWKK